MNRVRFCNVRLMSILGSSQGPRLQRSTIYVHDVDLSAISVFHNFNNSLTKESTGRGGGFIAIKASLQFTSTQVVPSVHTKVYQNSYSNETISRYSSKYINSTYKLSIKSNGNKGKFKKKKKALQRRKN